MKIANIITTKALCKNVSFEIIHVDVNDCYVNICQSVLIIEYDVVSLILKIC